MKAKEVLRRYAAEERNFRGVNLRGQSFKSANLSGADFSEADIRSTDFSRANLTGANFTGVKCGLQKRWVTLLTLLSWLLAGISGFLSSLSGYFVSLIFNSSDQESQIVGWVSLLVLVLVLIVTIRWGTVAGTVAFSLAGVVAVAFAVAGAVAVAFSVAFAVGGAVAFAVAVAVAFVVAVVGAFSVAGAVAFSVAGAYIGWRALKGDKRDAWVRSFAIAFAALRGTSFRSADLTGANFTSARLKSTDLRKATLTGVRWYRSKMLDRVRPGNSYLKSTQVRQWLIGEGKDKNFDGQKLQGINLQGADLSDASFIDANLSEANLQDADLSRAKLVQTQLDGTDFTGATLTGAFIEDWGITSSTVLRGVKCEYVFMRLPPEKRPKWLPLPLEQSLDPNPRRKPDNWEDNFEGDDFADFIKPIFDTLDLYHNQGVDPRAIAISWKQLAENHPDANLRFASMEVKGEDNLLLRLKTAPNTDLSRLNAEYFTIYTQIKALAEEDVRKLIAEKDNRIQELETMVNTALKRPSFYAEHYQGDTVMTGEKRDIKINKGKYYEQKGNFGIGHNEGEIKGNAKVAGVINEAEPQNLADAAQEIQQLLEQLSKTYPTTTSREKNIVVGEVVDRIESNPQLKTRVINALKAGGTEAFKEAINHPLVNILMATIEGWQEEK